MNFLNFLCIAHLVVSDGHGGEFDLIFELFVHYSIWWPQVLPKAVMHMNVKYFNGNTSPNAVMRARFKSSRVVGTVAGRFRHKSQKHDFLNFSCITGFGKVF